MLDVVGVFWKSWFFGLGFIIVRVRYDSRIVTCHKFRGSGNTASEKETSRFSWPATRCRLRAFCLLEESRVRAHLSLRDVNVRFWCYIDIINNILLTCVLKNLLINEYAEESMVTLEHCDHGKNKNCIFFWFFISKMFLYFVKFFINVFLMKRKNQWNFDLRDKCDMKGLYIWWRTCV